MSLLATINAETSSKMVVIITYQQLLRRENHLTGILAKLLKNQGREHAVSALASTKR
ncbi:hypothetical protein [Streptococcus halichoeri]|uniref:hypothetical protein n=1 Tax=Streptococcus halichoeri TaxID=254785 RepID=UPI00135AC4D4|nr:hypothetical protein [Streptococcus halichoeri]